MMSVRVAGFPFGEWALPCPFAQRPAGDVAMLSMLLPKVLRVVRIVEFHGPPRSFGAVRRAIDRFNGPQRVDTPIAP